MVLLIETNVPKADVPFQVRLDPLDKYMIMANNVHDFFKCHNISCKVPLVKG